MGVRDGGAASASAVSALASGGETATASGAKLVRRNSTGREVASAVDDSGRQTASVAKTRAGSSRTAMLQSAARALACDESSDVRCTVYNVFV